MRISDFRIHSIAMADPPLRSSYGLHQPYALRNVIELESGDGVVGIAETYGGDQPVMALEAVRGQVVGACPYRLTGDLSPMVEGGASGLERSQTYNVPGENPLDADARTYSAIETACLDLIGKSVGNRSVTSLAVACATKFRFPPIRFTNTPGAEERATTCAKTNTARRYRPSLSSGRFSKCVTGTASAPSSSRAVC